MPTVPIQLDKATHDELAHKKLDASSAWGRHLTWDEFFVLAARAWDPKRGRKE
jgi:hypothetical protein